MKIIEKSGIEDNGMKMAWNEPGGSGGGDEDKDKKDPWGNRDSNKGNNQSPPDLDEVVKQMQDKVTKLFGGKGGGNKGGGDSGGGGSSPFGGGSAPSSKLIGVLAGILFFMWLASGIYIVDPAERGVVLRLGAYVETTQPGPHWHLPYPFDHVEIVDVDQSRNVEVGYRSTTGRDASTVPQESMMLTQDENIVDIKFAVQYRVKDAKDYLFAVRDPDVTLRQATESAIREAIGKSKMDFVLTEGQSDIAERTETLIQTVLDNYKTGLLVTSVNLQSAQPPEEVRDAFEDAIRAREDQQRLISNAEAYSNDIIPKARGNAARQLEASNGYKERVIAQAEGESSRFTQLLKEFEAAPEVTRERLYLETIETVMSNTTKVMIDVDGGNNLLYLPLDRLMGQGNQQSSPPVIQQFVPPTEIPAATQQVERRLRDTLRDRGAR